MKKTQLQQILSTLEPLPEPSPDLEQYQTPSAIAADAVNLVNLHETLEGRTVLDLGTGNGILAIAAALCGATVSGVDVDPACVTVARSNAARVEEDTGNALDVSFTVEDVETVDKTVDVVVMNPAFGIQTRDANKTFLAAAFTAAPAVYSFLHVSPGKTVRTETFYENYASEHGYTTQKLEQYDFPLSRTQTFHTSEKEHVPVGFYRFTTR